MWIRCSKTTRKRCIAAIVAGIAICVGLVVFFVGRNTEYALAQLCPVDMGNYYATVIVQDDGSGSRSVRLPDEELRDILAAAQLKKGHKFKQTPPVAFEIRITDDKVNYLLVIGNDSSVAVGCINGLEGTRTFWKDSSGELFSRLYDVYLRNGGTE